MLGCSMAYYSSRFQKSYEIHERVYHREMTHSSGNLYFAVLPSCTAWRFASKNLVVRGRNYLHRFGHTQSCCRPFKLLAHFCSTELHLLRTCPSNPVQNIAGWCWCRMLGDAGLEQSLTHGPLSNPTSIFRIGRKTNVLFVNSTRKSRCSSCQIQNFAFTTALHCLPTIFIDVGMNECPSAPRQMMKAAFLCLQFLLPQTGQATDQKEKTTLDKRMMLHVLVAYGPSISFGCSQQPV